MSTEPDEQPAEQISEERERIFFPSPAETACRFRIETQLEPMVLFDYTAAHGGWTCHLDGGIDVFMPAQDDGCRIPSWGQASKVDNIGIDEAERQFMSCTALFSEPGRTNTGVILFSPKTEPFDMDDIATLHRDLQGLISNDGLAVTYEGRLSEHICLEASEPERVLSHILGADMVPTDDIGHQIAHGTCLEIGSREAGQPWPDLIRTQPE